MVSKRKSRQDPPNTRQSATQLLLLPDDGTRKKVVRSARLPDGQEEARAEARTADKERRNFERFLKRMHLTAEQWEMKRRHYLEQPIDDDELKSETWKAAKMRHSGLAVEVALERQKKLSPDLWMVAFLMAQCNGEKDMVPILGIGLRRVQMHIHELRIIVRREVHADSDSAITRWFLGL